MADDAAWAATGLQDEIDFGVSPSSRAVPAAMYAAWADLASASEDKAEDSRSLSMPPTEVLDAPLDAPARHPCLSALVTPAAIATMPAVTISRIPANAIMVNVDLDHADEAVHAMQEQFAREDEAYADSSDDEPEAIAVHRGQTDILVTRPKRGSQVGYI